MSCTSVSCSYGDLARTNERAPTYRVGDEAGKGVGIAVASGFSWSRQGQDPRHLPGGGFLRLHSWLKERPSQMEVIVEESSFPCRIPQRALRIMPLLGSYLACLPYVQTTGCKLDHFSMLCWNLHELTYCPSVINILIPSESFCKEEYFVSHNNHWSPCTVLRSVVFGKISAKRSRRPLRCACFFLSFKSLSAPTCWESSSSLLCGCISVSSEALSNRSPSVIAGIL